MRAACSLILALLGCGAEVAAEASGPGPDCAVWIAAGERARGCDPAIAGLLQELQARPEERRCRAAARQLLAPLRAEPPRIFSVYEPATPADAGPLTVGGACGAAPHGAAGHRGGDARPGPRARCAGDDGGARRGAARGRRRRSAAGTRAPGEHTLALRHANAMSRSCVTLRACETVALTGHGAEVAPHPSLRAGPCP